MIITHNQEALDEHTAPECLESEPSPPTESTKTLASPSILRIDHQIAAHHPRAGVNPVVDAAGYLFTLISKWTATKDFNQLAKLRKELIQEVNTFEETITLHGYNEEYILVCRYVMCAVIDESIENTNWGGQNQWQPYLLLNAFNQTHHEDNFYIIMERAIKEPAYYIDLMELMYICLSMGYRGHYQGSEQNHTQREQITNLLYKHIRAYRGSFSKSLSPSPIRTPRSTMRNIPHASISVWTIFLLTACIIMILFISLGYLMEMISNEAFNNLTNIQTSVARHNIQQ
jgi:type VI secretion system protein ImpK